MLLVSNDKIISLPKAKQTGAERTRRRISLDQSVFSIEKRSVRTRPWVTVPTSYVTESPRIKLVLAGFLRQVMDY